MSSFFVIGLGLIAQGLFAARFVVQLIKSEKSQKVESPSLFWQLSILASFLLIIYGFIRNDIVIVGGQLVGYFIYIRNLHIKGDWAKLAIVFRVLAFGLPTALFGILIFGLNFNWGRFLLNPEIDGLLLTWGTLGQVVFTSRFIVQWLHSEKVKESAFPVSFWFISIIGAIMIAIYAIVRQDAVLFIGQAFGFIVYSRNLYMHYQHIEKKSESLLAKFKTYRFPALMAFTAMVLFFNLGSWEVTESSEARYAQIPKEMIESGDYLHPTLMGIYHYHKPPMTYWITAAAYQLFGVSSWSARFFLQIGILLQIGLVYLIGKLLFGNVKKAFYAAVIFASFPTLIISGRALTTDGYLAVFVLAAIYAWLLFQNTSKNRFLFLFYLMLGLGFLTKGPVVLIVPVVVLVYQRFSQKISFGKGWVNLIGLVVFLLLGLGWFVFLYLEDKQFLDYFVFKHTIQRFSTNTFSRSQPFWFYIAIVIATAFPWALLLMTKVKSAWQKKNKNLLLLMVWMLVPLVFFSLSQSKLVLYILPVYPGIAMAAAFIWMELKEKEQLLWDRIQFGFQMLVLTALAFSPLIDPNITLNYKFYFIIIVTASLLISFRATSLKVMDRAVLMGYIFLMGITASSTYFMGNNSGMVNDPKNIAAFIQEELPEVKHILVYNRRMPSMSFLTGMDIISLYDGSEDLNRETQFQKDDTWKSNLINLQEQPDWLSTTRPLGSVLMVKAKQEKNDIIQKAVAGFDHKKEIDGWVLYY